MGRTMPTAIATTRKAANVASSTSTDGAFGGATDDIVNNITSDTLFFAALLKMIQDFGLCYFYFSPL